MAGDGEPTVGAGLPDAPPRWQRALVLSGLGKADPRFHDWVRLQAHDPAFVARTARWRTGAAVVVAVLAASAFAAPWGVVAAAGAVAVLAARNPGWLARRHAEALVRVHGGGRRPSRLAAMGALQSVLATAVSVVGVLGLVLAVAAWASGPPDLDVAVVSSTCTPASGDADLLVTAVVRSGEARDVPVRVVVAVGGGPVARSEVVDVVPGGATTSVAVAVPGVAPSLGCPPVDVVVEALP